MTAHITAASAHPAATHEWLVDRTAASTTMRAVGMQITDAEPVYIRHKPGESTLVAYRFALPDEACTYGYARWCVSPVRAEQVMAKAQTLRPRPSRFGEGLYRVDPHTVLYGFPNDARLRRIRWYTESRKLKRSLAGLVPERDRVSGRGTSVRVLRYKPERRVVAHVSLGSTAGERRELLVRQTTKPDADGLRHVARHMRSFGVAVPEPIASLDGNRVSIDEFVNGVDLHDIIDHRRVDRGAIAAAIAGLHRTPPPPWLDYRSSSEELGRVQRSLATMAAWMPELATDAAVVGRLVQRRRPATPADPVLVHGDLHAKNLLVTPAGDPVLVDLERVAVGSPAIDLGYFLAHAIGCVIRSAASPVRVDVAHDVVDATRVHRPVGDAELAWHTAIGLIDQAVLVVRHLEPSAFEAASQLLAHAESVLSTRHPGATP